MSDNKTDIWHRGAASAPGVVNLNIKPAMALLLLLLNFIVGFIITGFLTYFLIIPATGGRPAATVYLSTIVQDIFLFIAPPLVTAMLATRRPARLLGLMEHPKAIGLLLVGLMFVVSVPAQEFLIYCNYHLEWISQELADYAKPKGITLTLETVNRFEQFMFNDAKEATQFVKDCDRDNVKVMLDSFHMNIEEDSFYDAIVSTGSYLGHFHIGEANRKCPGQGRLPWDEIGRALRDIGYEGTVVMEPFVRPGGGVGSDIKVWRDISEGASDEQLDKDAAASCAFVRKAFCG